MVLDINMDVPLAVLVVALNSTMVTIGVSTITRMNRRIHEIPLPR